MREIRFHREVSGILVLIFTCFALQILVQNIFLSALVFAILQYHLVLLLHECVHRTFHSNRRLNDLIGKCAGALVFIGFESYQNEHWAHHRHTAGQEDPDKYIYHFEGKLSLPGLISWIFFRGPSEIYRKQSTKGILAKKNILRILSAQIIICASFSLFQLPLWQAYIFLWLLPLGLIAFFINRARINIEHGFGRIYCDGIDLIGLPFIIKIIFFPFSFNYHHSHHLNPNLPSYQLSSFSLANETNKLKYNHYLKQILRK